MKENNDSIFIKIPEGKKIKFIETYKNVLFIKLRIAKAKKLKEEQNEKNKRQSFL